MQQGELGRCQGVVDDGVKTCGEIIWMEKPFVQPIIDGDGDGGGHANRCASPDEKSLFDCALGPLFWADVGADFEVGREGSHGTMRSGRPMVMRASSRSVAGRMVVVLRFQPLIKKHITVSDVDGNKFSGEATFDQNAVDVGFVGFFSLCHQHDAIVVDEEIADLDVVEGESFFPFQAHGISAGQSGQKWGRLMVWNWYSMSSARWSASVSTAGQRSGSTSCQ